MKGKFLFLGSGSSMGVPVIGCGCGVCLSSNPRNKRLRPSGLIEIMGKIFLIDAGPDLREQALKHAISKLDGLLLTHTHFDHVGGIDDIRAFYFIQKHKVPCLLSRSTMKDLQNRLPHLFLPIEEGRPIAAQIDFQILQEDFGVADFQGIKVHYLTYEQAGMKVTGFRFRNFAYVSDIRDYTEEVFSSLKGVEILVLSALRHTKSLGHLNLEEAVAFAQKIGAKQTWLTHIAHELDHEETNRGLPPDIQLAHDAQQIEFII